MNKREKQPASPKAPKAVEPKGEKTIVVPAGVSVEVSEPSLVERKYLRVTALREFWRGGIKHTGTADYAIDGPSPELTQEQISAILRENGMPKAGLKVVEIFKFVPAE